MDAIPLAWQDGLDRNLAGGDDLIFDYTILAMAIVALSLILVVEVVRHKIDNLAHGKAFFENVLETFYRERECSSDHKEVRTYLFLHYNAHFLHYFLCHMVMITNSVDSRDRGGCSICNA